METIIPTALGRKAGTLREVKELVVSGPAITLGNELDVLKQPKAIWSEVYNLGNSSNLAKLGVFSINLHKSDHLVGFIVWS